MVLPNGTGESGQGDLALVAPDLDGKVWRSDPVQGGRAGPADGAATAAGLRVAVFARVVAVGMVFALVFGLFVAHYLQKGLPYCTFLYPPFDCFMDFFNINSMSYDLDPYPAQSSYPPLALLLARCFSFGFDYKTYGASAARSSLTGQLNLLALAGSFCAFLFAAVYRAVRTGDRARDVKLALIISASYPVLFLIDRGNYLMVAFAALFGFVHYYERNRRLANLFLALAISLKIYPLLFLFLLAADRRWRDCAAVLGLTGVISLGAMLAFKGSLETNVRLFIQNVLLFSKGNGTLITDTGWNLSFSNLIRVPYAVFLQRPPRHLPTYYPVFTLAALVGLFWALRREPVFWKRVLLVTIACVALPNPSYDYNLVYLLIPLLLYFREAGPMRREDYFYLGCAGLLFVPKHYHVLGVEGDYVLTPQAFLNPLLLLALSLKVAVPRSAKFVLAGGAAVLAGGVAFCLCRPAVVSAGPAPPYLGMKGMQGWWVLREGFTLTAPTDILRVRPVLHLRGLNLSADKLGGKLPGVRAKLAIPTQPERAVPASLVAEGDEYVLTVHLDPLHDFPKRGNYLAEVRLSFDTWFVPKDLGLGGDTRALVMPTPHSLDLLPAPPRQAPAAPRDDTEAAETP
jgi:hypothetical protein